MMIDPYCYENSNVLKNKLGIKDGTELERTEVDFSCNAIHELSITPLDGNYNFEHFCNFHAYIFRDIYEWAGEPRTVEMEKAEAVLGYISIEYAKPKEIHKTASLKEDVVYEGDIIIVPEFDRLGRANETKKELEYWNRYKQFLGDE